MSDPGNGDNETEPDNAPASSASTINAKQEIKSGDGFSFAGHIIHFHAGETSPRPRLSFGPWMQKINVYDQKEDTFREKYQNVQAMLKRNYFCVIESRLPTIVEDLFQLISQASEYSGGVLRAIPAVEAIADFTITRVLSDISNVSSDAIFFFDLRSLPESARDEVRSELSAADLSYLTQVLKNKNSFCLVFAPTSDVGSMQWKNGVSFSYLEEESVIVDRAAFLEGNVQSAIVESVREQMKRSMWGKVQIDQLNTIDDAIRSGEIGKRVNEFTKKVVDFDVDANEYAARLKYLLQDDDGTFFKEGKNKPPIRPWSEIVTSSLIDHALFILTNFDGLTPGEFDRMMVMILRGKSVIGRSEKAESSPGIEPHPREPNQTTVDKSNSEFLRQDESKSIESLTAAYNLAPDRVLRLLDVRQENGRLEFLPAHKKQVARDLLRSSRPLLMEKLLVQETIERSMLFELPGHIAEQLAERYAEHTIWLPPASRGAFVFWWTEEHARQFVAKRTAMTERARELDPEPLKSLLTILGDQTAEDVGRKFARQFTDGVSLFLLRLLAKDETALEVDELLVRLTKAPGIQTKYDLVFMFVRTLRKHPSFRSLFWLKRLLAEGGEEVKGNALEFLARGIELGRREGDKGSDRNLLQTLQSWVPDGVKYAFGQNSQTAALLAPRLALHRALANIRDHEHGAIDQLPPLFDLNLDDGLAPDFQTTVNLLTVAVAGNWVDDDLELMNQLAEVRWQLNAVDRPARVTKFPSLAQLERKFASSSWTHRDSRHMALVGLLVETIAALTGNPENENPRRTEVARLIVARIAANFEKDERDLLARRAYGLDTALRSNRSAAAQRRGQCARWIGDTFYELYKTGVYA